ncbi:MAG: DnaJ like chaperone protein [Crocinitomicaceae bacterium]|jgi:DnaJ like chaperone protein
MSNSNSYGSHNNPKDYTPELNSSPDGMLYGLSITFALGFALFLYRLYQKAQWNKKFTFGNLRFDNENLLGAYVILSSLLIQADRKAYREKVEYMKAYFHRYFPNHNLHFTEMMNDAFKKPIEIKRICSWLSNHLEPKQRLQVVYFLAGLTVVDGGMDRRETALLRKMSNLLQLTPKEFDSIIAMYNQKQERTKSKSKPRSKSSRKSFRQLAFKILGVSEHADFVEIKKAYRTLVKKHHPDRFASESEAEQKIATERFLEVQKAYEMIEKYK